jgi:hypothetical protein
MDIEVVCSNKVGIIESLLVEELSLFELFIVRYGYWMLFDKFAGVLFGSKKTVIAVLVNLLPLARVEIIWLGFCALLSH